MTEFLAEYDLLLNRLIEETAHDTSFERSKRLAKAFGGKLLQENTARSLILKAGGTPNPRPKGIPVYWQVALLPGFNMRYINSMNSEEYVEVIQDALHPSPLVDSSGIKILYHHPKLTKNGEKDFPMHKVPSIPFDLAKDKQLLIRIKNSSHDLMKRIDLASETLGNYFFSLNEVQEIRETMGFPLLEPEAIDFLQKACLCHKAMLSKKGGGIISNHPRNSQFSLRASKPTFTSSTYMKLQTSRGYHTSSGQVGSMNSKEVHLTIQEILSMRTDFYDPPCTIIKPFHKFDYSIHKVV